MRAQREWNKLEKINIINASRDEADLSQHADRALTIIVEDGTTVIFPKVVEQLREDFKSASDLLAGENTGAYTQLLQKEIERTLEELIEALQKAQDQKESQSGQSGESDQNPQQPNPPLVPESAELKLLKAAQLRVNRRTEMFDKVRPADQPLDDTMKKEVGNIADRQAEVAGMAQDMTER